MSALLAVAGWWWAPGLMQLLGADEAVIALATPYATLMFLILPVTVTIYILSAILQGTGDTRTPALCLLMVNLLYFSLAISLIYGSRYWPMMGIRGAAVGAGLAESVGVTFLLWRCRSLLRRPAHVRWDLLRSAWQIGAPASGERVVQQAGILLYTKLVIGYGTVAYAAHQVGLSIEALSFLPGYGFAVAAAAMVGQSIGAGKYQRAKMENWEANRQAALMMATMGLVFFFFPTACSAPSRTILSFCRSARRFSRSSP